MGAVAAEHVGPWTVEEVLALPPDVVVTSCPGAQFTVLDAASVLLVAEVVSPSTVAVDRMLKPQLYAAAGIPHYLRVELDGAGGPSVAAFDLTGGEYRPVAEARAGGRLRLEVPVAVMLDPATRRGRQR